MWASPKSLINNNKNNMSKYIEVKIKDSEDVYYIQKLNVRDKRDIVTKLISFLSPILGSSLDSFFEAQQKKILQYASADPESIEGVVEEMAKFTGAFTMLSVQVNDPVSVEIQDLLLKGVKYSSNGPATADKVGQLPDYDIEEEEDLKTYLKLLKLSFEVNAYNPLVECLDEMGYSEIVGKVQTMIMQTLPTTTP